MTKESDILKIVKEDILRILGEEESKKTSLESIELEIKVSNLFLFKAVEELEKEDLIESKGDFISLTKEGEQKAKNIIKKHLVLESYFKKTRGEREAHEAAHILEHYVSKEVVDDIKKLSTLKKEGVPLTKFEIKKEGIITDIMFSDYELFERIVSMGMYIGEKIRITNKIPNAIIIALENKKFALDKDIAKGIKVLKYERA